jgi:hypothetical protein
MGPGWLKKAMKTATQVGCRFVLLDLLLISIYFQGFLSQRAFFQGTIPEKRGDA